MKEKLNKVLALAEEVVKLSRNTLLVHLRFLDAALHELQPRPVPNVYGTDGKGFYYDPVRLLKDYKAEQSLPVRDYLHVTLHCIFRHMFVHSLVDRELWNLSCDIAVEAIIADLGLKSVDCSRATRQATALSRLKDQTMLTAEKLYRYFQDNPAKAKGLAPLFLADEHELWYMSEAERALLLGDAQVSVRIEFGDDDGEGHDPGDRESQGFGFSAELEERWKEISERMQMDLETFSKQQGDCAGHLTQNLKEVNREKYDYTSFLKKFAVMGEAMKINDDEFDYIFYTYGLQRYGKMPLIEPLEYKEIKLIKEFVIAIDTSGSVAGDLVQAFLQKTYNILKSTESFFQKINLHIIQCDADIQEAVKITCGEDFDRYLETMQIKGLGGTDFRPVFEHVDRLIQNKEFTNLKGLIYFTDGCGTFPAHKPPYETAFIFIDEELNNYDVPPWAIKLILQKEEI